MLWIGLAVIALAGGLAYRKHRSAARPRPLRNDAVAGLTREAMRRLRERVHTLDRLPELAPTLDTRYVWDEDKWVVREGVEVSGDDIPDLAIEYAAIQAIGHKAPMTEETVAEWLQHGVTLAIAQFVLCGVRRAQDRMAIMTRRSPPPTAEELAELRRANERERAEMDKLLGKDTDDSKLPTATLRPK